MMNKFHRLITAVAASIVILTGCAEPKSNSNDPANTVVPANPQPAQKLSISDIEALVRAKVNDDAIISQIQKTRSYYHLSPVDIIHLRDAGVSDKVVNFMISTASLPAPPPAPVPVVVKTDYPPPPPAEPIPALAPAPGYVWVGGEWQWHGDGWVWASGQWAIPPWPNAVWIRGYWYRGPFGGWRHSPGHWR